MKYSDIVDIKTLKAYCKRQYDTTITYPSSHSPFHSSPSDNYLGFQYSSPSGALGYRLFNEPVVWCFTNRIKGVVYSYSTPIGLILDNTIIIAPSQDLPFKSCTSHKLCTILNRRFITVEVKMLKKILNTLEIKLGWLE